MQYMIQTFGSQRDYDEMAGGGPNSWSNEEVGAMVEFMTKLNNELEASGELVETRGLAAPVHTRRIGGSGDENLVTDGPYAETQEVLAGYWVVECDSFDRAVEIAAMLGKCPGPEHVVNRAYTDVRPIASGPIDDFEG